MNRYRAGEGNLIGGRAIAAFFILICTLLSPQKISAQGSGNRQLQQALAFDGVALAVEVESGRVILFKSNLSENIERLTIGSTVKPFTLLTAWRAGVVQPQEKVFCRKSTPETPTAERCWFYEGHGAVELREAIANSCNVYFRALAGRVEFARFIATLKEYQLCDNCAELAEYDPREQAELMIGMGNGIKTTLNRLLAAYVALYNGGRLFNFNLKAGALPRDYRSVDVPPDYLTALADGMRGCAVRGTCDQAQRIISQTPLLGKTGTSYYSLHGGDYRKTHGLFIALAPYPKPKLALLVFVEEGTGASDAVPIGGKLLKVLIEEGNE